MDDLGLEIMDEVRREILKEISPEIKRTDQSTYRANANCECREAACICEPGNLQSDAKTTQGQYIPNLSWTKKSGGAPYEYCHCTPNNLQADATITQAMPGH